MKVCWVFIIILELYKTIETVWVVNLGDIWDVYPTWHAFKIMKGFIGLFLPYINELMVARKQWEIFTPTSQNLRHCNSFYFKIEDCRIAGISAEPKFRILETNMIILTVLLNLNSIIGPAGYLERLGILVLESAKVDCKRHVRQLCWKT